MWMFAKIKDPWNSIALDKSRLSADLQFEVFSYLWLMLEIVFDINHRHGRMHKYIEGRILFLV